MHDTFDIHKWNKERYLNENNEPKPKNEFDKAEDNLYQVVTGEKPNYKKPSKNKMREPVKEETHEYKEITEEDLIKTLNNYYYTNNKKSKGQYEWQDFRQDVGNVINGMEKKETWLND